MPIETTQASAGDLAEPRDELPPLLVNIVGLSRLLHRSVASLHRDDAAGRLPAGLKLGASKRWRYAEIVEWVQAGMPDRETWTDRKSTRLNSSHTVISYAVFCLNSPSPPPIYTLSLHDALPISPAVGEHRGPIQTVAPVRRFAAPG